MACAGSYQFHFPPCSLQLSVTWVVKHNAWHFRTFLAAGPWAIPMLLSPARLASWRCPGEELFLCGHSWCCWCLSHHSWQTASASPAWRYVISERAQNLSVSLVQLFLLLGRFVHRVCCFSVVLWKPIFLFTKAVAKVIEIFKVNVGLKNIWEPEPAAWTIASCWLSVPLRLMQHS